MLATTIAGSLPKPAWLATPETLWASWRLPPETLLVLDGKAILAGVVDVASHRVETPEEVAATIRRVLEHVPAACLLPCTNCGMAPLPRDVARGKLRALGRGAALVRAELGVETGVESGV